MNVSGTQKGLTIDTGKRAKFKKFGLIFLLFLGLDQISKILVHKFYGINPHQSYEVIGDFFRITVIENPGAVFGISFGSASLNQTIFTIFSIVAIIVIVLLFRKSEHPLSDWGFTLILSGAVGNLLDRISRGAVIDFLDFDFPDFIMERWYMFNIADSCIVIGVIMLVIYYVFVEKSSKKNLCREKE
ncbi:MAG: signal peptidase II [Candidatus Cloacimonadia bacterium]